MKLIRILINIYSRFNYKRNPNPGPGAYDPRDKAFPDSRRLPRGAREEEMTNIPFLSTSYRFNPLKDDEVPGAGKYQSKSFIDDLAKKRESASFNSKIGRFDYGDQKVPGPGSYQIPSTIKIKPFGETSAFKSRSKKTDIFDVKEHFPSPDKYSHKLTWKTTNGEHISKDNLPRFAHQPTDTPGPGTYNPKVHSLNVVKPKRIQTMLITSKRFDDNKHNTKYETPGPGSYDPEYMYGNLNKPTFNITIAKDKR